MQVGKSCRYIFYILCFILVYISNALYQKKKKVFYSNCLKAATCIHGVNRVCGLEPKTREVRWFLNKCDIHEFNCEYGTRFIKSQKSRCHHVPPL